jgi:hypothetical protein
MLQMSRVFCSCCWWVYGLDHAEFTALELVLYSLPDRSILILVQIWYITCHFIFAVTDSFCEVVVGKKHNIKCWMAIIN